MNGLLVKKNGYYETQIGGYYFFFLNGNKYNSDTAQRNWLKGRLAEITSDSKNSNKPIFVNVHQPISNTVMDGQQASNPNLNIDLKDYPQVITLSGHSHLNNNDDRSIHQKDFTSLNLGSMSYIESDHGYQSLTAPTPKDVGFPRPRQQVACSLYATKNTSVSSSQRYLINLAIEFAS
ncbi:hypothetical protein [Lederbergia ruris]|uniref:hypothetical protein n=1 Tax=Lederbergia ruris TaxID=217495 RepID=UPI00399F59EE